MSWIENVVRKMKEKGKEMKLTVDGGVNRKGGVVCWEE